jgi:hypothetical protein
MRRRRGWLWHMGFALFVLVALLAGVVVGLALWFQARPAPLWIALWVGAILGAVWLGWRRGLWTGSSAALAGVAAFAVWWGGIAPTNDRDWQPEVAELLQGETDPADASRITLHNVRNFDWHTPTEATERWETRVYDLDTIETIDVILTYWAGPAIAHTMVSFGFADGEHMLFSVGIRPARGQAYSSIAGFFKAYELALTGADEHDAVRLRTSMQEGNRVHLYRLRMPPETVRELFLEYVALANDIAERPRFYRTILENCTTVVWRLVDRLAPGLPIDYRVVLSGYLPGYLHDLGALDPRFSLAELERIDLLPADVPEDVTGAAYSAALRAGIPPL